MIRTLRYNGIVIFEIFLNLYFKRDPFYVFNTNQIRTSAFSIK